MNGFQPYVPVPGSLKRLQLPGSLVKKVQKGAGGTKASVKIVSPTEQLLDQAKESLKRNKKEIITAGGSGAVVTDSLTPSEKKRKTENPSKKSSKKPVSKTCKIHKRYGKKGKK